MGLISRRSPMGRSNKVIGGGLNRVRFSFNTWGVYRKRVYMQIEGDDKSTYEVSLRESEFAEMIKSIGPKRTFRCIEKAFGGILPE